MGSAVQASRIIGDGSHAEAAERLLLSLWIIALTEAALLAPSNDLWNKLTQDLCTIGYRLPIDQLADLQWEIKNVHDILAMTIDSNVVEPVIVSETVNQLVA